MSLLRLLTSGKSLIGLKKLENRYHLPGEKAIPQFGSKKNPFRATVFPDKPEPSNPEVGQPGASAGSEPTPADARNDATKAPGLESSQVSSAGGLTGDSSQPTTISNQSEAPARRPSALRALLLWGRARKSNSTGPVNGRPLIQAELSLDSIRVVRNDLSESDLEIVPLERKQKPRPAAPSESGLGFAATSAAPGMDQVCGAKNM
jgi:hypothetical protein